MSLDVCWILTDADNRSDGRFIEYLQQPHRWRHYDPELFDALAQSVATPYGRDVRSAAEMQLIPGATFYDALLTDRLIDRRRYFEHFLEHARGTDLVFFDPDNGLEVRSKVMGARDSCKYLYWDELSRTYDAGHSVLVYQHFPRVERGAFLSGVAAAIGERTGAKQVVSFRTANVVFLLVPQPRHLAYLQDRIERVQAIWGEHIQVGLHL